MSTSLLYFGSRWARLRCHVWALQPAWPPLLIVGLYAALLLGADQVQDAALGAVQDWHAYLGRASLYAFWNVLFGLSVWFSARILMAQHRPLPPDLPPGVTAPQVTGFTAESVLWLARLLGAAVPLLTALAFFQVGRRVVGPHHLAPALDQGIAAAVVVLIAWARRPLVERLTSAGSRLRPKSAAHRWTRPRELGIVTIAVCVLWFAGALGCMIWAASDPVGMGQALGPFSVLALGLIGLCFGLTALAFVQRTFHAPAFALAFLIAVISGRTGDNHTIPAVAGAVMPPAVTLQQAYDQFLARPGRHRLLLVATAGGGIRAAFWTAYALGRLHDQEGATFDNALFAISGVSGGGVGAVFYRAMLAEHERGLPICTRQDHVPLEAFAECAEHYLGQDGIGPVLASMLFSDLAQRFLPVPWLPDRAAALTAAWSTAWAKDAGTARGYLDAPFVSLWQPGRPWPILLLNGTSVAHGRRILTSNIDLGGSPSDFNDVQPFPHSYAISAAMAGLNTARFPFVSPPGGIPAQLGVAADQVVDGGVFENSGAETTLELLHWIRAQPASTQPEIAVLQITSDPDETAGAAGPCSPAPPPVEATTPVFLPDVSSGLTALFRSRNARGVAAMAALRTEACKAPFHYAAIRLNSLGTGATPPLGWSLSGASIQSIKACWPPTQDGSPTAPTGLNSSAIETLRRWLEQS